MQRRRDSSHIPPSYVWIKGIAIFWLFFGSLIMMACAGLLFVNAKPQPVLPNEMTPNNACLLFGFFGLLYTVVPIGLLLRTRWSYYGGIAISSLFLLFFPIGTVLGIVTINAFGKAKGAFGIR
ncbi:MAG: hypothetical protein ABI162_13930 [Luteolibacter sp.]